MGGIVFSPVEPETPTFGMSTQEQGMNSDIPSPWRYVDDTEGRTFSENKDQPTRKHPWFHLKQYFLLNANERNHAVFSFVLCQPNKFEVRRHPCVCKYILTMKRINGL